MQRSILIQALSTSSATESLVPGRAPPTPPRSLDPNTLIMEDSVLYNITIDDLNIHEIFEHSLATMIRNRRDLIKEIFSILAPHEIKTMLPTPISCMKPKEVMKLCYMQLKEMPEAHLVAILTHLANPQQASITYYKPSNMKTKSIKKRIAKSPSKSASPVHKTKKSSSKSPQTNIIGDKSPSYRSTEYFTSFSSPSKKRKAQSKSTFAPEKSKRQQSSPQFWDTSFDYSPQKIPEISQETSHHRFDRNKRNSAPKMCSSPFTSTNYESISKDRYDNTYSYRRSRSSSPNLNDQTSVQDNTLPRYYNTNVKTSTTADTKHSSKISSGTKKTSSAISKYSPTYRPHIATTSTHQKTSHKLQSSSSSNNKVYTSLGSRKAITSAIKKHKKVFSTHRDFTTTTSSISGDRYRISPKKSSFSEKKSLSFDYFEKEVKSKDKDNRKRLSSTVVNTSREYDQNKKSKK